ncbi:MAG: adenylate/guanylate cyclase domain-containing protein [Spirochaetota bacterium]
MEQKDYRLAAIMYTDISGFSRMMERDEAGTLELLHFHNELIGGIVASHHGSIIKTIGDALLVDFRNTVEALQSALEIQDRLYVHNRERAKLPLLVRIGLHLGDIYFYENDALGEGINIAARLQSLARPGCVCFSQDVYNQVLNKIEFRADRLGKVSLKNITKEIHAYEITTPNVEFDPDRDKPRPGYQPGVWLEGDDGTVRSEDVSGSRGSPAWASPKPAVAEAGSAPSLPEEQPPASEAPLPLPASVAGAPVAASPKAMAGEGVDRSYSEEGSRNLLTEIRKAILEDIRKEGRRLSVDEARERYGFYGVEAQEVIAAMMEQGFLLRSRNPGLASAAAKSAAGWGFDINAEVSGDGRKVASDLGRSIEAAVHGIVSEIERSVERNVASGKIPDDLRIKLKTLDAKMAAKGEHIQAKLERKGERHRAKQERKRENAHYNKETQAWDRKLDSESGWKEAVLPGTGGFPDFVERLGDRAQKVRGSFITHLATFLGVNGFLWFLNLSSTGTFLWAAIVSAAWGIGVASNAASAIRSGAKAADAARLPELDEEQIVLFRKIERTKDSYAMHATSVVSVSFLLGLINFLTGPGFLWFLIPAGGLLLSLISHRVAYGISLPRLEREFAEALGVKGSWKKALKRSGAARKADASLGPYSALVHEAEQIEKAILELAKDPAGEAGDVESVLRDYVAQVRLLAGSAVDIDRVIDSIPRDSLCADKETLIRKEAATTNPGLKLEYRKNIEEIQRQESSWEDLGNQREILGLRLGSSVNQLKQMRMDLARVKAAGDSGKQGEFRTRTTELSKWLEDLRKGYEESQADPYDELEKQARKAELEGISAKALAEREAVARLAAPEGKGVPLL